MAVKTLYFKNVTANGALSLQDGGTAPATGITTTGWTVARIALANFSLMAVGSELASTAFSTADALATPALTAASSWRSENTFTGTFAGTSWSSVFRVRAVSAASSQAGRVKARIWKSTSNNGTSGNTQLTTAVLTGTTTAALSTTVSQGSTVTWPSTGTVYSIVTDLGIATPWGGDDLDMGIYQTFTTTSATTAITSCTIALKRNGSPSDNVTVDLLAFDGTNKPTGSPLGSCTPVVGSTIPTSNTRFAFTFTAPVSVSPNTTYALVVKRTAASPDSTNCYSFVRNGVGNVDPNQGFGFWAKSTNAFTARGATDIDSTVSGSVAVTFNNEYLFVQCEWEITTASGSNSGDVLFFVESAGAITTPDFIAASVSANNDNMFLVM